MLTQKLAEFVINTKASEVPQEVLDALIGETRHCHARSSHGE